MNGKAATKVLLIATACIEAPTGLLLLAVPSGVAVAENMRTRFDA